MVDADVAKIHQLAEEDEQLEQEKVSARTEHKQQQQQHDDLAAQLSKQNAKVSTYARKLRSAQAGKYKIQLAQHQHRMLLLEKKFFLNIRKPIRCSPSKGELTHCYWVSKQFLFLLSVLDD